MNAEEVMIEVGQKLGALRDVVVVDYTVSSLPSLPAVTVSDPPQGTYDLTYGQGLDMLLLRITVFVSKVGDIYSRSAMSPFISGSGDRSVRAALGRRDIRWRSCSAVHVTGFETVFIKWDKDTTYKAALFTAEVHGGGDA